MASESISVICWWWWDTVAILEDYSDSADAEIAAGTLFEVTEIPSEDSSRVLAKLDRPNEIMAQALPTWYQSWWMRLGARCVDFHVEIAAVEIETKCSIVSG